MNFRRNKVYSHRNPFTILTFKNFHRIMVLLLLITILILIFLFIASNNSSNNTISSSKQPKKHHLNNERSYFPSINPYREHIESQVVVGIWAEKSRIKLFHSIKKYDVVRIEFDISNKYDKYALGVYSLDEVLLGYLPTGQRKIIRTIYEFPNVLAYIANKEEIYDEVKGRYNFQIKLKTYLGFDEIFIAKQKEKINNIQTFVSIADELRDALIIVGSESDKSKRYQITSPNSAERLDNEDFTKLDERVSILLENYEILHKSSNYAESSELYYNVIRRLPLTPKEIKRLKILTSHVLDILFDR